MNTREAEARLAIAALSPDGGAIVKFEMLGQMLRHENAVQNLVSAASLDDIWQRHFLDSTQLMAHVPRGTSAWLDLGSGAGFPGLALAIVQSEREFHLVESRALRSAWLVRAVAELELANVRVIAEALEKVPSDYFGVISARAFAPMPRLIKLAARFSTSDTAWVLPKGRSAAQELVGLHGWDHTFHVEQSLTDPTSGIIVGRLLGKKGR